MEDHVGTVDLLKTRIAERDARLARIVASLNSDPRIEAMWLFGSLGRGGGDAWSDLDLWISVRDEDFRAFVDERTAMVARIEAPLFSVEAPQNAFLGGAYFQTVHDDPTGPHIVDWYVQPMSIAGLPNSNAMLLGPKDESRASLAQYRIEAVSEGDHDRNEVAVFWMMVLVQAKLTARYPYEDHLGFQGFLDGLLDGAREHRGLAPKERQMIRSKDPQILLDALCDLVDEMKDLTSPSTVIPERVKALVFTVRTVFFQIHSVPRQAFGVQGT